MKYNLLGQTGVKVSELCFGTMAFGGDADEAEATRMFNACRAAGVNFFDCANGYNEGRAEQILAKLIAADRDNLVVTSKCYVPMGDDINARGGNRRHIMQAVEASLKRLNTDRVDVLFMHRWDPVVPLDETLRALEQLVTDGKVVYLGASNYSAWQVAKGLGISERKGWSRFDVIQPMYSLAKRQAEVEILPLAAEENIGVISYSPVGGGLLSGRYSRDNRAVDGRLTQNAMYAKRYGEEWLYEVAEDFTEFAKARGVHPVSLAVAWVSAHPAITAPIVGARSLDQLGPSLDSVNVAMDDSLYDEISALSRAPAPATDRLEERS